MNIHSKVGAEELFSHFGDLKIMIIGDVMIDSYLFGKVDRISPEAPVPIVAVNKRTNRLGGAANVALNIKAMGATPFLCSVTGDDDKAGTFEGLLRENDMFAGGILKSSDRITTTKFRVIGNNSQMLRVDEEVINPLSKKDNLAFTQKIDAILKDHAIDAIIFQDYDKGVITADLITHVTKVATQKNIPVTVDPKKKNFTAYRNVSLFKPNLKELREGLGLDIDKWDQESLKLAAKALHLQQQIGIVLITMSEAGVYISHRDSDGMITGEQIPAHHRSIADVSGAGDTVISLATMCLALGLSDREIAAISNLAGGQVCEFVGVVPVDRDKLLHEVLKMDL